MSKLKQIQKTFLKFLEKELMLVLAVLMIAVFTFWVNAAGDSVTCSLSVYPVGGAITVTYPNGGDTLTINDVETITWTTQGPINNVKIEFQREVGGDWEELIDSTTDDGEFPWTVTSPVTTTALIKITKVGDNSITDTSDAIFTIDSGVSGGGVIYNPAIDTVTPLEFSNATDVDMIITGFNFSWGTKVWLGSNYLKPNYIWPSEISVTIPVDFTIGKYTLCIQNLNNGWGCYHLPIIIYEDIVIIEPEPEPEPEYEEDIIPPSTGGDEEEIYSAKWIRQSSYPVLEQGEETTLWVDFKNTGNMPWFNYGDYPVRLGTSEPLDRASDFKNGDWISDNRLVYVKKNGLYWITSSYNIVNPGEIGRFTFTVKASNGSGKYREYFRPVVEYKTWMEDWGVYWDITIKGNAKIDPPTTGGTVKQDGLKPIIEEKSEPLENKVFIDVERQYPVWLEWLLSRLGFI